MPSSSKASAAADGCHYCVWYAVDNNHNNNNNNNNNKKWHAPGPPLSASVCSAQALPEAIKRAPPSLGLACADPQPQGGVKVCHQDRNLPSK